MFRAAIVEDDEFIRTGLEVLVTTANEDFICAETFSSAGEALERFRVQAFDLLITDIEMPHTNGLRLIELLRAEYPSLLCVIITGYDRFEYAREGLRHGTLDYLLKPVDEEELHAVLLKSRTLLEERRLSSDQQDSLFQEFAQCVYRTPSQLTSRLQILRRLHAEGRLIAQDLACIVAKLKDLLSEQSNMSQIGVWRQLEILAETAREKNHSLPNKLANDIAQYIGNHFAEDLNVTILADVFHVTPAYLGQVYLKVYKQSLNAAIHACRIRHAEHLLLHSSLSIAQIGEQCGYKTLDHFYRQFRKIKNETPLAFRTKVLYHP